MSYLQNNWLVQLVTLTYLGLVDLHGDLQIPLITRKYAHKGRSIGRMWSELWMFISLKNEEEEDAS